MATTYTTHSIGGRVQTKSYQEYGREAQSELIKEAFESKRYFEEMTPPLRRVGDQLVTLPERQRDVQVYVESLWKDFGVKDRENMKQFVSRLQKDLMRKERVPLIEARVKAQSVRDEPDFIKITTEVKRLLGAYQDILRDIELRKQAGEELSEELIIPLQSIKLLLGNEYPGFARFHEQHVKALAEQGVVMQRLIDVQQAERDALAEEIKAELAGKEEALIKLEQEGEQLRNFLTQLKYSDEELQEKARDRLAAVELERAALQPKRLRELRQMDEDLAGLVREQEKVETLVQEQEAIMRLLVAVVNQ